MVLDHSLTHSLPTVCLITGAAMQPVAKKMSWLHYGVNTEKAYLDKLNDSENDSLNVHQNRRKVLKSNEIF